MIPGPGYKTLLLRLIPGDLLSICPHRQFHTLPGLLDNRATLPNSNPNALRAMQGGSLYHFYDGLWYDPAGRRASFQLANVRCITKSGPRDTNVERCRERGYL